MAALDLSGHRFGKLVALEPAAKRKTQGTWLCQCDCGKTKVITTANLRGGHTRSCGCFKKEAVDSRDPHVLSKHRLNLIGHRFGKLVVLEPAPRRQRLTTWLCQCDCGQTKIILTRQLKMNVAVSCGCIRKERKQRDLPALSKGALDLTRQKFGKLVALEPGPRRGKQTTWRCRCGCGQSHIATTNGLRWGSILSCGCSRKGKVSTAHPLRQTPLYKLWQRLLRKCHNPTNAHYRHFGAKGISVCQEWRDSFDCFMGDVSSLPNYGKQDHSLYRLEGEGNYCPGNVRWNSSLAEQAEERMRERELEIANVRQSSGNSKQQLGRVVNALVAFRLPRR